MVCMYRGLVTMTKKAFPSSSSSSVQELYDLCIMTFTPSGTSPASPQAIQKLCSLLDTIRPADIGLKEEDQGDDRGHGLFGLPRLNRVGRWAQPITYVDVHECDSFTMCIFCFPTSSVIPLHNHPGMTVLSKVLYGSLHVKAYDWVEPEKMQRCMGPNDSPGLIIDSYMFLFFAIIINTFLITIMLWGMECKMLCITKVHYCVLSRVCWRLSLSPTSVAILPVANFFSDNTPDFSRLDLKAMPTPATFEALSTMRSILQLLLETSHADNQRSAPFFCMTKGDGLL
ncbi:hypothetical protein RHMOL_Rhmol08G0187600 [Rhododendron molle]|uniref:Uncharacterized protein n=1 Tax=Rhododendron molle TaxID=49168 RepID=A0ACC0MPP5_RHOML|nr:hypothetical protein RHMOL_Rhmol08G0187600 [Rhododendron molle]